MNTNSCTDGELLNRIAGDSAASEAAFQQLVERYSPLVINVCTRCLFDVGTVEDAAQATFLVLWRKANRLTRHECVAGWLHRVARNICRNANRSQQARRARETEVVKMKQDTATQKDWDTVRELIDDELDRIPEKYRVPLILRYLEGHGANDVAELMGIKASTVRTRLSRGREMLRARLIKRGVAIGAAPLAATFAANARAAQVPTGFVTATSTIAKSTISPTINLLATGVIQAMAYKTATVSIGIVLAILASLGGLYVMGAGVAELPWRGASVSPATFSNDRGAIIPLTSDLQRAASTKLRDADVLMVVNGSLFFPGIDNPSQEDVDQFDYSTMESELGEVLAGAKDATLVLRIIWPSWQSKSMIAAQFFQSGIMRIAQPFCKEVRLGSVQMPSGLDNGTWHSEVLTMVQPPTREELRTEKRFGDSQVGVFAVRTPLSRYLYGNVDCVVHLVPLLENATPAAIEAMRSGVAQLDLPTKNQVSFLCYWKDQDAANQRRDTYFGEQVWRDQLGFESGGIQIQLR